MRVRFKPRFELIDSLLSPVDAGQLLVAGEVGILSRQCIDNGNCRSLLWDAIMSRAWSLFESRVSETQPRAVTSREKV